MADTSTTLPKLTAEQRRAAVGQFERAKQVLQAGDHEYGLRLLLECCKIDPANLIYRQTLRQAQRARYGNNERGQPLAYVRSIWGRLRLKKTMLRGDFRAALVDAELILMRNPWDLQTHLRMAEAFEQLEWPDHALWTLEQIRPTHPTDPRVNRPLAQLYEARGNFNQAIALWELVKRAAPNDLEAQNKAKDLSASATIAKGRYEEAIQGTAPSPAADTATEQPALAQTDVAPPSPPGSGEMRALAAAASPTTPPPKPADRQPRDVALLLERIKATPNNTNIYMQLANVYKKAEQFDKAKAILQQGLEPTGNAFELTQELLDMDIEPFRRDLEIAEERLRKRPGDAELQQICARFGKEVNTRELELHRRRSDRYPTDNAARFEMGLRLLRANQLDEAIKELQAVRNDPRHLGKATFYLGMCFKQRKNWRLAQRNFEESLQHLGAADDALRKEAMFLLSAGYAEVGEIERAIDLGCELANLDYNYKNIGALLDVWQAKATS
jgi:tetratricopeptide (TPR) repeat protein